MHDWRSKVSTFVLVDTAIFYWMRESQINIFAQPQSASLQSTPEIMYYTKTCNIQ